MGKGWIGVDLDATLAYYTGWDGGRIGRPIPEMVAKVKEKLTEGVTVKIFTARMAVKDEATRQAIARSIGDWTELVFGVRLEATNEKDFDTQEIWDDRCRQVVKNEGVFVDEITSEAMMDALKNLIKQQGANS